MTQRFPLILASASPRRLALLEQARIFPENILVSGIEEEPRANELPRALARRLATEKAKAARKKTQGTAAEKAFVLAADTVVAVGRRVLPKADTIEEATGCMRLLSARAHRVYTGLCLITPENAHRHRVVETRVRFKRLSRSDINAYLASGEWVGKAGAYAIQGIAGAFVVKLIGSYSNVVGLPLYETVSLLHGEGYPIHDAWENAEAEAPLVRAFDDAG